jgi:hypothetical protein
MIIYLLMILVYVFALYVCESEIPDLIALLYIISIQKYIKLFHSLDFVVSAVHICGSDSGMVY